MSRPTKGQILIFAGIIILGVGFGLLTGNVGAGLMLSGTLLLILGTTF